MDRDKRRTTEHADDGESARILRFQNLADGATFADRYAVRGLLGSGGSGEVYRAFDRVARVEVALKVLFPGTRQRNIERLRREMRVVRSLQHPGILRVHDIGEAEGLFYTVSELLEGETLADRLRRQERMDPRETERVLRGILEALAVAHQADVIHRDIKPGNVFLARGKAGDGERVVLLDFGLARQAGDRGLTATGRFIGTPEYCSPEQILGERTLTSATDLYACGITLWQMLAGRPPFRGNSEAEVFEAHLRWPPPSVWVEMPGAPGRLRHLALMLLEKKPSARPSNPTEALRLLDGRDWFSRIARARATLRHVARRKGIRIASVSALAVSAAIFSVYWLSVPVSVRPEGSRLVWKTRGGFEVPGASLPSTAEQAVMVGAPGRYFADVWVTVAPSREALEAATSSDGPHWPTGLFRASFLSGHAVPLDVTGVPGTVARSGYRYHSPLKVASSPVVCGRGSDGSATLIAVLLHHPDFYPAALVFVNATGQLTWIYHHPGWLYESRLVEIGSEGRRVLVAVGTNNLLGLRGVIVALDVPSGGLAPAQAPPFTEVGAHVPRERYYLPLPFDKEQPVRLSVHDGVGSAHWATGREFRFDLETGTPLDESNRGGLSPAEWSVRMHQVVDALSTSSDLAIAGRPAQAAKLLEDLGATEGGSPELKSIPWYRAAQLRLEAVEHDGVGELGQALSDIDEAIRHEPAPPRYRLLQAEILARLGRKRETKEALDGWFGTGLPMYHEEWAVMYWLIGEEPPVDTAAGSLDDSASAGWPTLLKMMRAARLGEPYEVLREFEGLELQRRPFGTHDYWAARACIDRPNPKVDDALRYLADAAVRGGGGVPLPIELARLRALLTGEPGRVTPKQEVDGIVREFEGLIQDSYRTVDSLYLVGWALADAEWLQSKGVASEALRASIEKARVLAKKFPPATKVTPPG